MKLRHQGGIADISAHEAIARVLFDVGEVAQIAGVGQFVQIDQAAVRKLLQGQPYEVGADEAAAAGNQNSFHSLPQLQASE